MRIGIDGRLWNETGVGRYIRNLVWQLLEIDKDNNYVLFVNSGFKMQDLGLKNSKIKVVETDVHWHSLAEQVRFPNLLYKENLDLMHFSYFSLPIFYNRPFVVTIHDLIINHFPTGKASTLPYPIYQLKRLGYDAVMRHAVSNSTKIIVPLHAVKKDLVKMYGVSEDKITVTYEGVDCSSKEIASSSTTPRKDKYFLYVGNAYPHKNLDFLIEAFLEFKKTVKEDVKLVLVGKEDYFYQRLEQKIAAQNLESVIVKHTISDEALFVLYSQATAFVSASQMEGFGLPALEAMSSSCLVLLSDIASFQEVCGEAAFYFNPRAKKSLQEQFSVVYNLEHTKRQEHIKKGLERVKDFSWKKMAEETVRVYESSISIRQSQ